MPILASRGFFIFIVGLMVFQALWVAVSFRYPMLWDEYYHYGLIQYYSHHLSPFITHQPHSLDVYGDIQRSPKYLYHYVMSFPFRAVSLFTANQTVHIMVLRLMNIGLFAGALVAYRAAMLQITKSRALVHFVLLLVVLFPLSSLLAPQINYDNLQFLLTGLVFYWALRYLNAKKPEAQWLLLVLGVGLLASVVKYTFLPLLAVIGLYLIIWTFRRHGKQSFGLVWQSVRAMNRWLLASSVLLVLIGAGLCAERFGGNLVRYHAVDPKCSAVLGVERCLQFSPFKQVYTYSQLLHQWNWLYLKGPVKFTATDWISQLYDQYFTTGTQLSYEVFNVAYPLKIPFYTTMFAIAVGLVCLVIAAPRLLRRPPVQLVLLSTLAIAAALWVIDYSTYRSTAWPLAIQGRYLLPMVPLLMLVGALAISRVLRWHNLKYPFALIVLLGCLWGGGVLTHIALSQPSWYWQVWPIIDVNQTLGRALNVVFY